jgi:hypothetical protein
MVKEVDTEETVEIDEPAIVEGVFFRQGLQALERSSYQEAVTALKKVEHSRHYGAHYFLGVALLREAKESTELAFTKMIYGLELMLQAANEKIENTDPSILFSFTEEVHEAVKNDRLAWKNEEFDLDGSFEELNTLVLEVQAQLQKGKLDDGLVTELCCAILGIFESVAKKQSE